MKEFIDYIESIGFKATEGSSPYKGTWINGDYKYKICISCGGIVELFKKENCILKSRVFISPFNSK